MKKEKHCECCGEIIENDQRFCSEDCGIIYYNPEPNKPKTKAQVIRMGTDIDGNLYVAE